MEVYERSRELRPPGAGLSIWGNAARALDLLGVGGALRERAAARRGLICRWNGEPLSCLDDGPASPRVLGTHRADLQELLLQALGQDAVQPGAEYRSLVQDRWTVCARLFGGREVRGDILIGAAGIHSAVRPGTRGGVSPRHAGYTAWRGVAAFSHPGLPPFRGPAPRWCALRDRLPGGVVRPGLARAAGYDVCRVLG